MIRLACKIPMKVVLACSGGRDSMSALEFLLNGKREVELAYFDHKTSHGSEASAFVWDTAFQLGLTAHVGYALTDREKKESQEAYWHRERHNFFER